MGTPTGHQRGKAKAIDGEGQKATDRRPLDRESSSFLPQPNRPANAAQSLDTRSTNPHCSTTNPRLRTAQTQSPRAPGRLVNRQSRKHRRRGWVAAPHTLSRQTSPHHTSNTPLPVQHERPTGSIRQLHCSRLRHRGFIHLVCRSGIGRHREQQRLGVGRPSERSNALSRT